MNHQARNRITRKAPALPRQPNLTRSQRELLARVAARRQRLAARRAA